MQDEELKSRLKSLDIPPPSDEAKARALAAAMRAFDAEQEKKQKSRQGFGGALRPIHTAMAGMEQWIRSISMKHAYIVAGGCAALVLAAVAINHQFATTTMLTGDYVQPQQAQPEKEKDSAPAAITAGRDQASARVDYAAPGMPPTTMAESVAPLAAMPPPPPASPPPPADAVKAKQAREMVASNLAAAPGLPASSMPYPMPPQYQGGDKFNSFADNPLKQVAAEPVSTFSIDVDTASYSAVRRAINGGSLPQKDMVRIEEMVNYFDYDYPLPESKSEPFKPTVAVYPTPWNQNTKLIHIGIKGHDVEKAEKPRSNLVFLIDVSGSMNGPDRLPLVKTALKMLVDQLDPNDTIGIVTYAGYTGTALAPTKVSNKQQIVSVIESLGAGGSTAGASGIEQAYALAQANFDKRAVNRVILATDGDFNVGVTSPEALKTIIEQKRASGIFLSILGFGEGNYNDALMQTLAQNGNGTAAYIDNINEARKVLVEEAGSTLFTIAKDVKIQVEFNPALVSEYRLVGYESRMLNREDFNNDKVDAGDVGSGHAVTAIYEITPAGSKPQSDPLRYGQPAPEKEKAAPTNFAGEYAFLKIRYKLPNENESKLITTPIDNKADYDYCPPRALCEAVAIPKDTRFATAVAAFGLMLRGDSQAQGFGYDQVIALAEGAKGADKFGYRAEFVHLVRAAKALAPGQPMPE